MSLQYIIDAYNLINHPLFKPPKQSVNIQCSLADFIRFNKLSGSKNNQVVLAFDGHPPAGQEIPQGEGLTSVFSYDLEADELIKRMIERSGCPKDIVVISDDKEVCLMSRFLHARAMSVSEFICGKENKRVVSSGTTEGLDLKLTYAEMQKINAELKKKWL